MVYNQQKFISYSSGPWEFWDRGRFGGWWERAYWCTDIHLLPMSSYAKRDQGALRGIFYKGTNPIHEASTLHA